MDNQLKLDLEAIAQDIAPKDTGNLAFNSIHRRNLVNGVAISYRENIAPYVVYLEVGTQRSRIHKGFIKDKTVSAFLGHINSYYNGGDTNLSDTRQRLAKLSRDNPARQQRYLKNLRNVKEV